jgi:S1-C subfamily serine protease
VDDPEGLGYRLGTKTLGGQAAITVLRGGKKQNVSLDLKAAPDTPARDPLKIGGASPFAGATVVNLNPAVVEEYSVEGVAAGVIVSEVAPDSTAANVNFQRGDVILEVNDAKIATTRDLEKATTGGRHYYWKITLGRGGQVMTTVIGG